MIVADYSEQNSNGFGGIDFSDAQSAGVDTIDLDDLPLNGRGRLNEGEQSFQDTAIWGVRTNLNFHVNDLLNFEYLGSFRSVDFVSVGLGGEGFFGTNPVLSAPIEEQEAFFDNFARTSFDQLTQTQVHEIRVTGSNEKLTYNAGFFLFDETGSSFFNTTADNGIVFAGVEFAIPDVNRDNFAFYGDATYSVTDKLRITGGIRYTEEDLDRTGIGGVFVPLGVNGPAFDEPFRFGTSGLQFAGGSRTGFSIADFDLDGDGTLNDPQEFVDFFFDGITTFGVDDTIDDALLAALADGTLDPNAGGLLDQDGQFSDSFIDWRVKAEYDITPDNLVYFTIATGTSSGGFNDTFIGLDGSPIAPTFESENLLSYEVGSKNVFEFVEGYPSVVNITGFFISNEDQQFTTLAALPGADGGPGAEGAGLVSLRQNIGDSRILGFDVDYTQQLPLNLTFRANLQFLDTEFTDQTLPFLTDARFNDFTGDPLTTVEFRPEGNDLPRASDITANFTLSQAFETSAGQFDWIASVSFRSSYFITIFNGDGSLPDPELLGNPDPDQLAEAGIILSPEQIAAIDAAGGPGAPNPGAVALVEGAGTLSGIVGGSVRLDVGAGWNPNENVRFEVFAKNLTNQTVSQSGIIAPGLNQRFLNAPRVYGGRLKYSF